MRFLFGEFYRTAIVHHHSYVYFFLSYVSVLLQIPIIDYGV